MNTNKILVVLATVVMVIGGVIVLAAPDVTIEKTSINDLERIVIHHKYKTSDKDVYYSVKRIVDVVLRMEGITPDKIYLKKGETAALILDAKENCLFRIEGYDISTFVPANTKKELTFNAEIPGIFLYRCVIPNPQVMGPTGLLFIN
jgi:hypothetical protein